MNQQIRFCNSFDGTRIAYAITGQGPPLVKAPHWLTHLEYEFQSPLWSGGCRRNGWRNSRRSSSSRRPAIAARLEGLAEAGGVLISESVRLAVGGRLPFAYEFAGEHQLKNIAEPVRAYRLRVEESNAPSVLR